MKYLSLIPITLGSVGIYKNIMASNLTGLIFGIIAVVMGIIILLSND